MKYYFLKLFSQKNIIKNVVKKIIQNNKKFKKNCVNCNKEFETTNKIKNKCNLNCKQYVIYEIDINNNKYIGNTKNFINRKNEHLLKIRELYSTLTIKSQNKKKLIYRTIKTK